MDRRQDATFPELREDIEPFVRLFEESWARGARPRVEDHLPGDPDRCFPALIELVHAELEFRLKCGEPARVEEYLERFPDLASRREIVVGLIQAEQRYRSRREPGLDPAEFADRFPSFREELTTSREVTQRAATDPSSEQDIRRGRGGWAGSSCSRRSAAGHSVSSTGRGTPS